MRDELKEEQATRDPLEEARATRQHAYILLILALDSNSRYERREQVLLLIRFFLVFGLVMTSSFSVRVIHSNPLTILFPVWLFLLVYLYCEYFVFSIRKTRTHQLMHERDAMVAGGEVDSTLSQLRT